MATVTTPDSQGLKVVNIHQAKTHLSRLVEEAANGQTILIAKAGKPMAKLVPLDSPEPEKTKRRLGFMRGKSKCRMISTPCFRMKSRRCSTAKRNEAATRPTCVAVDCGIS